MKKSNHSLASLFLTLTVLATAVACVTEPAKNNRARDISSLSEKMPGEIEASKDETPRYRGCDDGLAASAIQRSVVLDLAVRQAEAELAKNPLNIRDQEFRSRIATFAAASVADTVPLISMDRSCWAEFYDGQKKLAAGDEAGAKENGEAWRICLEAMFPDRVVIAKPYFSCFNPDPSKSSPPPGH